MLTINKVADDKGGNVIDPVSNTACAAATCAIGAAIGVVFGPHIGVAELFASLAGAMMFFLSPGARSKEHPRPFFLLCTFVLTVSISLWGAEAGHALTTANTDINIPNVAIPGLCATLAYFMQAILSRASGLIGRFNPGNMFGGDKKE